MKLPKVRLPKMKISPIAIKTFTTAYFRRHHNRPVMQEKFLLSHVKKHADTAFGALHDLSNVLSVEAFQKAIPLQDYDSMYPRIERCLHDEKDVILRGKINRFATSSGTTGKNKYIPVTKASLKKNHYRASADLMVHYAKNNPATKLRQGQGLVIGGGFSYNPFTGKKNVGFISAILQQNSPLIGKLMKQPKARISYLSDRQKKVEKMIRITRKKNITSISGQPSWCSAYLEKMLTYTKAKNILEIRPHFELVIRGGMSIQLHKELFERLLPSSQVNYYQVYNASEGFFAMQHENGRDDMLLLVEHAVFYEFIPFEQYLRKDYSNALTLGSIQVGVSYVIIITNNAGLRRYVLGDIIEFTGTAPHTIKVIGRTKYYIDVAGECTPLQPLNEAIVEAAIHFGGAIADYTVGPGVMKRANGGHYELFIEWAKKPSCSEQVFAAYVDELLGNKRSYYHDERHDTHMLESLIAHFIPAGSFYNRLEKRGKLGGQYKLPKVVNDRSLLDQLKLLL